MKRVRAKLEHEEAVAVDYRKKALDAFFGSNSGKHLFLKVCKDYVCRVKVIGLGDTSSYENIKIKVLSVPKIFSTINDIHEYADINGIRKKFSILKKGEKLYVSMFCLYTHDEILKILSREREEVETNILSINSFLKNANLRKKSIHSSEEFINAYVQKESSSTQQDKRQKDAQPIRRNERKSSENDKPIKRRRIKK